MPARRREVCEEVVYAKLLLVRRTREGGGGEGRRGGQMGGKVLPRSAVKRQLNVVAILKRRRVWRKGGSYECKEILLQLVRCVGSFNYTAYGVLPPSPRRKGRTFTYSN